MGKKNALFLVQIKLSFFENVKCNHNTLEKALFAVLSFYIFLKQPGEMKCFIYYRLPEDGTWSCSVEIFTSSVKRIFMCTLSGLRRQAFCVCFFHPVLRLLHGPLSKSTYISMQFIGFLQAPSRTDVLWNLWVSLAVFLFPKKHLLFIHLFCNTLALQDIFAILLRYLSLFSAVDVFDSDTTTNTIHSPTH